MTSPADRHDMEHIRILREYLCDHATQLFHFIIEQHRLPSATSLHIVTGTTKSASWAIATHRRPMQPDHNSLTLKRIPRDGGQPPLFRWTQTGNAQTETRDHELGHGKNQCLFLRGFLLTPSENYLRRLKSGIKAEADDQSPKTDTSTDKSTGKRPGREDPRPKPKGKASHERTAAGHPCGLPSEGHDVIVSSLLPQGSSVDYPLYRINGALLHYVSHASSHVILAFKTVSNAGPLI